MFTLREINQMEREMCNYLDWELTVDNPIFGQQHQATPTKPISSAISYYQILVAFPASQDRVLVPT
ncbi:hypothetical protein B0H14DRAFT_3446495 [Mycena olivaceomarginata]|nr:hypothetical protein B0H14DRAFT_3446495 [Mycena olivaceomarginata]